MPDAVTKASEPTVTGCLSADARIKREDEIVPAEDEGQQARRRDAGTGERHRDARERAPPRMAGDAIGIFDVRGDILEIAAHDPQDQRQRDQLIDPDQADVSVGQADLLEIERERQQHEQRRREAERQEREGDVLAQTKLEAREGIGRGNAKNQRDDDRDRRKKHAVPEIVHESDVERAGRRNELAGDQRRVIGERRREEQAGRNAQDVLIRLERHEEDPEDREQEEDQDQRDERRRA